MGKILIVEDEPDMVLGLKDNFEFEGYEVVTASDGAAGLERARTEKPDLVILDIMLPKLYGLEVCKTLRGEGFDDADHHAHRARPGDRQGGRAWSWAPTTTSPSPSRSASCWPACAPSCAAPRAARSAWRATGSRTSSWTSRPTAPRRAASRSTCRPREFELLRYLIERKGETVSRDQLLEDVWGYESYPSTRTVDTHIAKLRAKIGDSGSEPRYILTIHGIGLQVRRPELERGP